MNQRRRARVGRNGPLMQKINWYIRRLCSMSPREVAWRCRCKLQDAADRLLVPGQAGPPPVHRIVDDRRTDRITEPDVLGRHLGSAALASC